VTEAERINALQSLGYNEREAAFLCLAALHSGYFFRRQYHAFAGVETGKASLLLEEKLTERRHAKVISFAYGTQLYHLCSRPFYEALGESNNRHRRSRAPLSIKAKLMGLDYVLGIQAAVGSRPSGRSSPISSTSWAWTSLLSR
jgi:hypothetical protein